MLLAFDVGTTAMKCILFDREFKELFYSSREYSIKTPREGIAELDPEVYFNTFCECVSEIKASGINIRKISSITFTTQGETFIPVDENGRVLGPAIVWLDTRAEKEAEYIKEKISIVDIYSHTGLPDIDGALPAAKILWLSKKQPEIFKNIHKILLLEDYLIYRLTGKFVSEKSLQSSTGWYDINKETLFFEMAELCGIKDEMLPEILPCATVVGRVKKEFGFGEDTVVTTGAMDQISSAVGVGNIREGIFSETTGTALVVGITAEKPTFDVSAPITVYKHFDEKFIYMPYFATAGMSLKWFRDTFMPEASYSDIDRLAEKSEAGSRGVIMSPDLSHGGGFCGITLSSDISDMARSVLEAVAFTLRSFIELSEKKEIDIKEIYSLGGGSKSRLWGQIKADVCQKNIIPVDFSQTTALGAAVLGSLAIGIYESVDEALKRINTSGNAIKPDENNFEIYNETYRKWRIEV